LELQILGSNAAASAYGRHHTAQVLKLNNKFFLIDCGEGTQIQIKKYKVKLSRIHCIVISHLHGDHYLGLTGLLNTMHLLGRESPLLVIGPPGLREMIRLQFKLSNATMKYEIHFHEWIPERIEQVYEDEHITIDTLPLDHKIPCSGYLFREKAKPVRIDRDKIPEQLSKIEASMLKTGQNVTDVDGKVKYHHEEVTLPPAPSLSYAFCSDTAYRPVLADWIQHVDLLYHESSFLNDMTERARETKHSTAAQAAMIAQKASAGKLLLGHFSSRYKALDEFLAESQSIFPATELAIEGKTFKVARVSE
jgi:ribonuclease Z